MIDTSKNVPTVLLASAFVAYATANLIHNDFGLDRAIAPAALLVGMFLWRRRPGLLLAAALMIALPSFYFLIPSELSDPSSARTFTNHVALLAAGVLAVASAVAALLARRRAPARA